MTYRDEGGLSRAGAAFSSASLPWLATSGAYRADHRPGQRMIEQPLSASSTSCQ